MVETENLQLAANVCLRLDAALIKAAGIPLPEPEKSAVIHAAENAAKDAGEIFRAILRRYLMTR